MLTMTCELKLRNRTGILELKLKLF